MPDQIPFAANSIDTDEIHLWQLQLSANHQASLSWLDQHELSRYQEYIRPALARRYLTSRCAMRQILSDYLGIDPARLNFSIQQGGKPVIESADFDLQFNLSRTGDVGLLAVARRMAVGVDIEKLRSMERKHKIAQRMFDRSEIDSLLDAPEDSQDEYFLELWTCMEARQKCMGNGIFGNKVSRESVGIRVFTPAPEYCAAVAWDNPSIRPILKFIR